MIKLDLNSAINEKALLRYADKVKEIALKMNKFEGVGNNFLGWKDLPLEFDKREFKEMLKYSKWLHKEKIQVLIVIGIGGSYLGARAGIEMIQGLYSQEQKMEIIFTGNSISSTDLAQKLSYVENKSFAINVISKSGTTTEPAIAFRAFKKLLEEKIGLNNAQDFIFATTDANNGALLKLANEKSYTKFIIPESIGGRFSVLTPVGLFPMACAGIDIKKVMQGAKEGYKNYAKDSINNEAYKYAVARFLLSKKFQVEMLVSYEPQMAMFNEWWKQLFGESEGKQEKGLLPTSAIFSTDLHSLGQFIQEGNKILFETIITVSEPKMDVKIIEEPNDLDNLNYLANKTVHYVNSKAYQAVSDAHVLIGKVPNIHLEIDRDDAHHFGMLVYFFQQACAMSAYLLGVNPFNQPGVEVYKQNMFKILGKPLK